jgi:hypothetical protein
MHNVDIVGGSSHANLKWVLNESKHELFIPIASNKNGQEFTKNFKAIIRAI